MDTQQTPDGIAVSWAFLHTGGSELQLVEIFLREDRDGATLELVPGGNLSRPLSTSFMIDGSNLQAGVSYEIAVRATNDLGVSEAIVSEIQESGIGMFNRSQGLMPLPLTMVLAHAIPNQFTHLTDLTSHSITLLMMIESSLYPLLVLPFCVLFLSPSFCSFPCFLIPCRSTSSPTDPHALLLHLYLHHTHPLHIRQWPN